jgi:hypothetical protein
MLPGRKACNLACGCAQMPSFVAGATTSDKPPQQPQQRDPTPGAPQASCCRKHVRRCCQHGPRLLRLLPTCPADATSSVCSGVASSGDGRSLVGQTRACFRGRRRTLPHTHMPPNSRHSQVQQPPTSTFIGCDAQHLRRSATKQEPASRQPHYDCLAAFGAPLPPLLLLAPALPPLAVAPLPHSLLWPAFQ